MVQRTTPVSDLLWHLIATTQTLYIYRPELVKHSNTCQWLVAREALLGLSYVCVLYLSPDQRGLWLIWMYIVDTSSVQNSLSFHAFWDFYEI